MLSRSIAFRRWTTGRGAAHGTQQHSVHQTAREFMSGASHFILYVADQRRSAAFYAAALGIAPRLDVPGMTEFALPGGAVLGLMPEAAIESLLGPALPRPSVARGVPRAELYLLVPESAAHHARALAAGAAELSPPSLRSWGHEAAYSLDPDGHVLAFASQGATGAASPVAPEWLHRASPAPHRMSSNSGPHATSSHACRHPFDERENDGFQDRH